MVSLGGDTVSSLSQGEAIANAGKFTNPMRLINQRQALAANSHCPLASALENPSEGTATLVANSVSPTQDVVSSWVSVFFQHFTQSLGFDFLLPQPTAPQISVVPEGNGPNAQDQAQLVRYEPQASAPSTYQVRLHGQPIASIASYQQANALAQRLEQQLQTDNLEATAIAPTLHQGQPAITLGTQVLFVVDENITHDVVLNREILAIQWANNLRLALGARPLDLATAQQQMYQLEETNQSLEGLASWYGPYFHGRLTANGEIYDQYAFTAAHPDLPLNTYLKVTNLNNDRSVIIRLNDRGPYIPPRSLDLSLGAARCLNSVETGVIRYKATIMAPQAAPPKAIAPDMI